MVSSSLPTLPSSQPTGQPLRYSPFIGATAVLAVVKIPHSRLPDPGLDVKFSWMENSYELSARRPKGSSWLSFLISSSPVSL
jgi:hypothetical protein